MAPVTNTRVIYRAACGLSRTAPPTAGTRRFDLTRQPSFDLKRDLSVDVYRACAEVGESVWSQVDVDLGSVRADFRNADAVRPIAQNTGRCPDMMIWYISTRAAGTINSVMARA